MGTAIAAMRGVKTLTLLNTTNGERWSSVVGDSLIHEIDLAATDR